MDLKKHPMLDSSKPFLRWWWFSGPLDKGEIDEQLHWIREKGFGGVEIAWVYPQSGTGTDEGPRFLDEEWQLYTGYAIRKCRELGLGCDLTFGTLWPFGGSFVPKCHSSVVAGGYSEQRLNGSWEARYSKDPGFILNHLDESSLAFYSTYMLGRGFGEFAEEMPLSFFCDSWEVEGERLVFDGLEEDFSDRFGYRIEPFMTDLDRYPDIRLDYRRLLSDRILEHFYGPYAEMCRASGVLSRVQCHGAPTDILAAYGLVDIPETETLLFDPDFSLIAASAAAFRNKPVVSSETFTCLYGWVPKPAVPPGLGKERVGDLQCVADAQFAWGVNRVVWHGKPYGTEARPQHFYATVHVGPDGNLEPELLDFNRYLSDTSAFMEKGTTYSRMAVYFPVEDEWMKNELPGDLKKPSSNYYWEFQETHMPDGLLPWRPLWFSGRWLQELEFDGSCLRCGGQSFEVFYSYAGWIPLEHLRKMVELLERGAPIIFERIPEECGHTRHTEYDDLISRMRECPMVELAAIDPVLKSDIPLDFWCRKDGADYNLFISHPQMRKLRYPMPLDYYKQVQAMTVRAEFRIPEGRYPLELRFGEMNSIMCTIRSDAGNVEFLSLASMET